MRCVVLALCLIGYATPAAVADPIAVTQVLTFDGIVQDPVNPPESLGSYGRDARTAAQGQREGVRLAVAFAPGGIDSMLLHWQS
jgi:hypothetical protein